MWINAFYSSQQAMMQVLILLPFSDRKWKPKSVSITLTLLCKVTQVGVGDRGLMQAFCLQKLCICVLQPRHTTPPLSQGKNQHITGPDMTVQWNGMKSPELEVHEKLWCLRWYFMLIR